MNPNITVQQIYPQITFIGTVAMANFTPFSFSATQGQTSFGPLPAVPLAIWVFVTGSAQNQKNGDFTINGSQLILSQGVNSTDTVYGVIQTQ